MSVHKQEYTNYGFKCDEGIVDLINTMNSVGIHTFESCQSCGWGLGGIAVWFNHDGGPEALFSVCQKLATAFAEEDTFFHLEIEWNSGKMVPDEPHAVFQCALAHVNDVSEIIEKRLST